MKNKLLLLPVFLLLFAVTGSAQIKNLYNFPYNENPNGGLTVSGNLFYGMTYGGGEHSDGYIFSMNKDGSGFKDLWDFYDTGTVALNANGKNPYGSLTLSGNKLYGMTYYGGYNGYGLVFSVNTDGTGFKDLWDFEDTMFTVGNSNGQEAYGSLTLVRNKLYGMTYNGGYNEDGNIFSVDTSGGVYRDLFDFSQSQNGAGPYGSLILLGGKLYGTTSGHLTCDCRVENYNEGNVFSIDTDGTHYKDVYVFAGPNGDQPEADLTASLDGKRLFGTTDAGGFYNDGVIFAVDTDGANFKVLVTLNDTNGKNNYSDLTLNGNTLYGMNWGGGPFDEYNEGEGYGNIFSVDTSGRAYRVIYNFNLTNGGNPATQLNYINDTLYGMTTYGGFDGDGLIFACNAALPVATGINNIAADNGGLSVYPNPSSGTFEVKSDKVLVNSTLKVYNMLGEEVYSQFSIPNSTFSIDLSNQASGIYMYRMLTQEGKTVGQGKIVIQK